MNIVCDCIQCRSYKNKELTLIINTYAFNSFLYNGGRNNEKMSGLTDC